jgi:hypothetical protein
MRCPLCQADAGIGSWRSRVRRGDKHIWVEAACWRCPTCRTRTGPGQFMCSDLADANEDRAHKL